MMKIGKFENLLATASSHSTKCLSTEPILYVLQMTSMIAKLNDKLLKNTYLLIRILISFYDNNWRI